MEQDNLRAKCIAYISKHGSSQTFFCKKLGISRTHFNLWLRGERDMADKRLEILCEVLRN